MEAANNLLNKKLQNKILIEEKWDIFFYYFINI